MPSALQAPTEPVLVHVNISDSARGAVFPPTLRSTPQDWTHPKAQLCPACFPHSFSSYCLVQSKNSTASCQQVAHPKQQQQHQDIVLLLTAACISTLS